MEPWNKTTGGEYLSLWPQTNRSSAGGVWISLPMLVNRIPPPTHLSINIFLCARRSLQTTLFVRPAVIYKSSRWTLSAYSSLGDLWSIEDDDEIILVLKSFHELFLNWLIHIQIHILFINNYIYIDINIIWYWFEFWKW